MTHLWVRAETRANENRVGITPDGVRDLIGQGFAVTVESSDNRAIPTDAYRDAGAEIVAPGSWTDAPAEAIILGLKELPDDGAPLRHRHVMFGHAYKGQDGAAALIDRFRDGGGRLYDLEYLTDEDGRRLAAFGFWAGYVGAALSLRAWSAQKHGTICAPVHAYADRAALAAELRAELDSLTEPRPAAIIVGAKGRVGRGAQELLTEMGCHVTAWDVEETAHGGPFPEILEHQILINAILAREGCPILVPENATRPMRLLRVIGDVACDPTSEFNPIRVYNRSTRWDAPVIRIAEEPPLDVMAIDNLPSVLPRESSEDFAAQILPLLRELDRPEQGAWGRSGAVFDEFSAVRAAE